MFQQTADKAPTTFHDVAAYFSDEEWRLLHEWQKDLYRNVMKDIHEALLSLGPLIAASVFSLRAKEQEYIFPNVYENSEIRHSTCPSTRFAIHENNFCLPEEEEEESSTSFIDAGGESSSYPRSEAAKADLASVVSFQIKEDGELLCLDHQDFEKRERVTSSPAEPEATISVVSFQIKEEAVLCPINQSNRDGKESIQNTPGEDWATSGESEAQNTDAYEIKVAYFNPPVEKANLDEPKSSKKEVHSTDQLWSRNIQEQEVMEIIPWENTFSDPTHAHLQHDTANLGQSSTLNGSSMKLSSAEIGACIGQTEKSQQQSTCTEPTKQFSSEKELINLKGMHTEERPHTCTYCDKRFSRKGDLNRHLTTHTGEKPYTCSYCQKSFNRKFNLNGHRRTHFQKLRNQRKYMEPFQIKKE